MKNLLLTLTIFLLMLGTTLNAQGIIRLNEPNKQRGTSIMQAIENKRYVSSFDSKALDMQDISDLLWAANGISRADMAGRAMPSIQNSHDIDIYVALEEAIYLYDPFNNILKLVSEGDLRDSLGKKSKSALPPCTLYLVSNADDASDGNKQDIDIDQIHAGIVSENIALFCAGTGLGTKIEANMNKNLLRNALKLEDGQDLVLNHPVGYLIKK